MVNSVFLFLVLIVGLVKANAKKGKYVKQGQDKNYRALINGSGAYLSSIFIIGVAPVS